MITRKFAVTAALALASVVLTLSRSDAAFTYNNGDILLGFDATGGTGASTDYEVDLGAASQFFNATTPFTLSFNLGADLTSLYGANWFSR